MAFWNLGTLQLEQFRPGIMSKAEIGDNLIMVCMQIDPGKEDTGHEHSFDQCGIVLEGQIEMFVGQERITALGRTHPGPGGPCSSQPTRLLNLSLAEMTYGERNPLAIVPPVCYSYQ